MSEEGFSQVLSRLGTIDPDRAFSQMYEFFLKIGKLDEDEIIALYHAFCLFRSGFDGDPKSKQWAQLGRFEKAIVGRMHSIIAETTPAFPLKLAGQKKKFASAVDPVTAHSFK
jgi:hypothetical protein